MAGLQWLPLILVMRYFFMPTRPIDEPDALILVTGGCAGFVLLCRYVRRCARGTKVPMQPEM